MKRNIARCKIFYFTFFHKNFIYIHSCVENDAYVKHVHFGINIISEIEMDQSDDFLILLKKNENENVEKS